MSGTTEAIVCARDSRPDPCSLCAARHLSVCNVLAEDGLRRLNSISDHQDFGAGEILVREGDPATNLFNITSGAVRVYKLLPDGRRQIVGFLFSGDFLGLATGDRYAFSAEALSTGSACRFQKKSYRKMLVEQPDLETALLDRASHELQAAHNQMLLLGRKTAVERLASFLADLAARDRRAGGAGRIIQLPMTRAEIADYLGLTTETVSRVTSRLKTRGVIRLLSLHSLSIEKPAELAELAGLDAGDGV
ncbi:MAG: cyclic nucleotide-binding domain-containing protein [Caulobacter sp.]